MGKRGDVFLVIDIGSSKISGVLGEIKDREIIIHSSDYEPTHESITAGKVIDLEKLKHVISTLLNKLKVKGVKMPHEASILISGPYLEPRFSKGIASISQTTQKSQAVETKHILNALEQAKQIHLPKGKEIVSIFPSAYYVDGEKVKRPYGMLAVRLEIDALVLTGTSTHIRNLEMALLANNVKVKEYLYQPIMASFGVLDPEDLKTGILLMDIGKDTTDMAIWQDESLIFTKTIPTGGEDITLDLVDVLHLRRKDAEKIKLEHGTADPESVDKHAKIAVEIYEGEKRGISKLEIAEIIEARVEDIFLEARNVLQRAGFINVTRDGTVYTNGISVGVVLAGGTSMLPGIKYVCKRILNLPCLKGKLRWNKIPSEMKTPAFASLWGAIEYKYRQIKEDPIGEFDPRSRVKLWVQGLKDFLKSNF